MAQANALNFDGIADATKPFNPPRLTVVSEKPSLNFAGIADAPTGRVDQRLEPNHRGLSDNLSTLADVAVGALKQPGRLIQMIPGVTKATDALYGLPAGSSAESMQAKTPAQEAGGAIADAAEVVAGGMAEAGNVVYTRNAVGQFTKAPYMQSVAGRVTDPMVAAARAAAKELSSTGPMTAERVGIAAAKYGKQAVKVGLGALGLHAFWKYL